MELISYFFVKTSHIVPELWVSMLLFLGCSEAYVVF